MEIINFILCCVTVVVGGIILFDYFKRKRKMVKTQRRILEAISPKRTLNQKEITRLYELYKINLELNTPVYSVRGRISYIYFEHGPHNHTEWIIGDISIAEKSIRLLNKKGVSLDEYIFKENDFEVEIELINKKLEKEGITEEGVLKEVQEIYETNQISFVLENPLKKYFPVYLLSYSNDKIDSPINLLS